MKHVKTGSLSGAPIELKDADPTDIVTKALKDLESTIESRITKLEAKSAERVDKLEAKLNRPAIITDPKDEVSLERKAFASFARAGIERMGADEQKALVVSNDPSGGYLAPPEVSTEMIRLLTQFSPIRSLVAGRQTGSGSVILPKRTGITNATWEGEIDEASESEPAFGQVEIPVHGMKTYTDISLQLLEDSVHNIEAELSSAFSEDFGKKESTAFINGSGVKQPRGIMVHPDIAYTPGTDPTNLKAEGLIDIFHAVPPAYRNVGVWLMNGTTVAWVRKLKDSNGDYLWRDSLAEGNPPTILGRPVIEAIDMPDVAAGAFPVLFGDIAQAYRIYDRVSLSVLRDPFTMATKSLVRFHARRRVGGDVVKAEAVRKLKIATA